MKKILLSFALIASALSCSKEIPAEEGVNAGGIENGNETAGEMQTIYATVNAATKVAYSENNPGGGGGMKSVWEAGDKFLAIQDGTKVVTFTIESGQGTNSAVFKCETDATESTKWTAVLGGKAVNNSTSISCGYMSQNGTLAGLSGYNYVTASSTGVKPSFDFTKGTFLSHVMRIKLPAGIKCIEYTPCASQTVSLSSAVSVEYFNNKISTTGATGLDWANDYGPDKTSTITLSSASAKGDIVYIAFPAIDYSTEYQSWDGKQNGNLRTGIIITLMNDTSDNATKSTGWVYGAHREGGNLSSKGGSISTVDMSGLTLISRPKPSDAINISTKNVTCKLNDNLTQSAKGMTTYWAPYNLGASKVSEPGLYFAYGEYWDNGNYGWGAYQQRHKPNGSNYYEDIITPATRVGTTSQTFYSIAGSRYDAARVLWGSVWRMPYALEIYAVSKNGTETFTTEDGVGCATFTFNKTKVVKFPDSGYYQRKDDSDSGAAFKGDAGYAYIRSADKQQRTQTYDNTVYRESFIYFMGVTQEKENADTRKFLRRVGFRGYPIRPVLASSTIQKLTP